MNITIYQENGFYLPDVEKCPDKGEMHQSPVKKIFKYNWFK